MASAWIPSRLGSFPFVSRGAAVVAATTTTTLSLLLLGSSSLDDDQVVSCDSVTAPSSSSYSPPQPTNTTTASSTTGSRLIFLGTGSSTGCPRPLCTMLFGSSPPESNSPGEHETMSKWLKEQLDYCRVSNLAIKGDPKANRDYRNNPSLLISLGQGDEDKNNGHQDGDDDSCKNVVIDVGKTFREGALRWFPEYKISTLDAIVLTHHHMDAVGGLDDVRGFQRVGSFDASSVIPAHPSKEASASALSSAVPVHLIPSQLPPPSRVPIPVFLSQECLDQVSKQFPWLFPKHQPQRPPISSSSSDPSKGVVVERDVAALDVHVIDQNLKHFQVVPGLTMVTLPVWHGDDLISLGFAFSITTGHRQKRKASLSVATKTNQDQHGPNATKINIVYISDVSRMIPETLDYILNHLPQPTHILIVDALLTGHRTHPVHYNLDQAVALVQTIQPEQAYLVGMSCDSFLPHDEMNQLLHAKYGNIQLAYDGQVIDL